MDFTRPRQRRTHQIKVIADDGAIGVGIAVRDVDAVAGAGGRLLMAEMMPVELKHHLDHFLWQRRWLSEAAHRFDREPCNANIRRAVHERLEVPNVGLQAPGFAADSVAKHGPRVGPDPGGAEQAGYIDEPVESASRDIVPARSVVTEKATKLAMGGEDAGDHDSCVVSLTTEVDEKGIRESVQLEERAELQMPHALIGHQRKQPLIAVAIENRVRFDAQLPPKWLSRFDH